MCSAYCNLFLLAVNKLECVASIVCICLVTSSVLALIIYLWLSHWDSWFPFLTPADCFCGAVHPRLDDG